jgi:hypothetical protein
MPSEDLSLEWISKILSTLTALTDSTVKPKECMLETTTKRVKVVLKNDYHC